MWLRNWARRGRTRQSWRSRLRGRCRRGDSPEALYPGHVQQRTGDLHRHVPSMGPSGVRPERPCDTSCPQRSGSNWRSYFRTRAISSSGTSGLAGYGRHGQRGFRYSDSLAPCLEANTGSHEKREARREIGTDYRNGGERRQCAGGITTLVVIAPEASHPKNATQIYSAAYDAPIKTVIPTAPSRRRSATATNIPPLRPLPSKSYPLGGRIERATGADLDHSLAQAVTRSARDHASASGFCRFVRGTVPAHVGRESLQREKLPVRGEYAPSVLPHPPFAAGGVDDAI